MSHIVAGRLQQQDQVQHAISQLIQAGFSENKISSFYVNPMGQHDIQPDPNVCNTLPDVEDNHEKAIQSAATGGVIGGLIGSVGIPIVGPLGTVAGVGVGAYVGSMIGTLATMDKIDGPIRKSGMVVAVSVLDIEAENQVINVLQNLGADQIERAEGNIIEGDWKDFNPLNPPQLVS